MKKEINSTEVILCFSLIMRKMFLNKIKDKHYRLKTTRFQCVKEYGCWSFPLLRDREICGKITEDI